MGGNYVSFNLHSPSHFETISYAIRYNPESIPIGQFGVLYLRGGDL